MNPILLQILSVPMRSKAEGKTKALNLEKGKGEFFSILQKPLKSLQKQFFPKNAISVKTDLNIEKGSNNYNYFECLKGKLLAKGGSLGNMSLRNEDLPLIEKFLYQCGFTKEDTKSFLDKLLENNHEKEINLSEFFHHLTVPGTSKKNIHQPYILETSAIPYIESILRDLGIAPSDIQSAFDAASVKGGGLDLTQFAAKLKEIGAKIQPQGNKLKLDQFVYEIEKVVKKFEVPKDLDLENRPKVELHLANQTSPKIDEVGIQINQRGKELQAVIKNFMRTDQQVTETFEKGNRAQKEIETTIDQIVERAVTGGGKNEIKSALYNFSKPELTYQYSAEKISKKTNIADKENFLSPLKETGSKENQTSFFSEYKRTNIAEKENLLTPLRETGSKENQTRFLSDIKDASQELTWEPRENKHFIRSEANIIDGRHDNYVSKFSETINKVKQGTSTNKNLPPNYLIDQVGKQISKSIIRGDSIVKLQLKPPELGTLRIEMDIKDNILKLGMITENSSAKELLLSNVNDLRDALLEQGVKLEKVDIQINDNFNQSLNNWKEGLKEQGRSNQGFGAEPHIAKHDIKDPAPEPWVGIKSNNLLDLVA